MKALILNNKVVDLHEQEFEVHSSLTWVDCDNTVEVGDNYDGSSFSKNIITFEMAMSALRSQRNKDLKDSDWTQLPDTNLTNSQKQAWMQFRGELRNITDNLTTVEQVNNIDYPDKPNG